MVKSTKKGPPANFNDLVELIRVRRGSLSPANRLIADRVMADPEGIAFMTITDLASTVGIHESTVVRFATSLGLEGYPALTRICKLHLREQAQLLRRFDNLEGLVAIEGSPLRQALAFDQANIARTFSRIETSEWDRAVEVLATAPNILILGLRKCYSVAYLLGYLLRLVRPGVRTLDLASGTLPEDLSLLGPGDVFVALAIHRYTAETVRAFQVASDRGATTIALTDNEASPLASHASHCFFIDTSGVSVLRSMTAFTAVVQALATAVATDRGASVRSSLALEESLYTEFGTFYESGPETE